MATQWLLSFFSSLFTVFVNTTNCIGVWVLLLFRKFLGKSAFFSTSLFFFHLQTQNRKHARLLERIWSNLQEFPVWLPPQSTLQSWKLFLPHAAPLGSAHLEGSSSGGCSPCLGCSSQGHHLLLWQLNARVKRKYGFSFSFAVHVWAYLLSCITVDWHSHPR